MLRLVLRVCFVLVLAPHSVSAFILFLDEPAAHPAAAQKEWIQATKAYLDKGGDINAYLEGDLSHLTRLHQTVNLNLPHFARYLLDRGADVNAMSVDGNSAIHLAVVNGDVEMLALLLDRGADIEARNSDGLSPLLLAIKKIHPAMVRLLLLRGSSPNTRFLGLETALHMATEIEESAPAIIQLLIEAAADLEARDETGMTPLIRAAAKGHYQVVHQLLTAKAQINAADDAGNTALHHAALNERFKSVHVLLQAGADPNARNTQQQTPLLILAQSNRVASPIINLLLEQGADPNSVESKTLWTPLHYVTSGCLELIRVKKTVTEKLLRRKAAAQLLEEECIPSMSLLLRYKADPNRVDLNGRSPLTLVEHEIRDSKDFQHEENAEHNDLVVMLRKHGALATSYLPENKRKSLPEEDEESMLQQLRILVASGEDPGVWLKDRTPVQGPFVDSEYTTHLHRAAGFGYERAVKFLIDAGVDVNAQYQSKGPAPLHLATENGHVNLVTLLLDAGADINATDMVKSTPLHLAVSHGMGEMVKMLLMRGARVNRPDIRGYTPLHIAVEKDFKSIVRTLLDQGAHQELRTITGQQPYDLCSNREMRRLLRRYQVQR